MDNKLYENSLVKLSITDLLSCLKESNKKDIFKQSIPPKFYNKIIETMRNESTIISLRGFHNWIKRTLISNITNIVSESKKNKKLSLLDIAVGRGGDIDKWNKAGINYVFGFDKSYKAINSFDEDDPGAKSRYNSYINNNNNLSLIDVKFEIGDATICSDELLNSIVSFVNTHGLFQIVSCQFALHYIFKSPDSLIIPMRLISKFLDYGGYFIGTAPDGKKIQNLFKNTSSKIYTNSLFKIQRNFNKKLSKDAIYGNEYTFTIYDVKDQTNYFNTIGISTEYLVDFNELDKIARSVGLEPVKLNLFESYKSDNKFKYTNLNNFISFEDIYGMSKWKPNSKKSEKELSPDEQELNSLYTVFIYKKIK